MSKVHLILDVGGVLVLNKWNEILSKLALRIKQPEYALQSVIQEYFNYLMLDENIGPDLFLAQKQINWFPPKDLIEFQARVEKSEYLNWELIDYLQHLRGCECSLLTNSYKDVKSVLHQKLGMPKFYRHLINSSECGILKPDPLIYLYALAILDAEPGKCIFVDDTEENIEGAVKIGMQGIIYDDLDIFKKRLSESLQGM